MLRRGNRSARNKSPGPLLVLCCGPSQQEMNGKEWQLSTILEILKSELGAREQCVQLKPPTSTSPPKPRTQNLPTMSALVNNGSKVPCSFCKGPHSLAEFSVVPYKKQRKSILRRQGRCYVRLKMVTFPSIIKLILAVISASSITISAFAIIWKAQNL